MKRITILIMFGFLRISCASLGGPYVMWGHEKLENLKLPALTGADEQSLSTLFTEAKAVVIFLRNSTSRLDGIHFPKFRQMIGKHFWTYLPQHILAVEPFNYNTNVEVINLDGPASKQDDEITSLFKESITIYGDGEVLGILGYREDDSHFLYKREVNEDDSTTTAMTITEEPTENNFVYRASGKALLYTSSAPLLGMNINGEVHSYALLEHDKENKFESNRLDIGFKVNSTRLRLRFNFTMSATKYWSLNSVEVEYKEFSTVMPVVGPAVVAPKGFSYRCSTRTLFFRNEKSSLTLTDYQVQPWLNNVNRFSDAYYCVDFITVPIWSGLFVSIMLVGLLFVGILALMDIKPPNRFENVRNKQLTFIIQE